MSWRVIGVFPRVLHSMKIDGANRCAGNSRMTVKVFVVFLQYSYSRSHNEMRKRQVIDDDDDDEVVPPPKAPSRVVVIGDDDDDDESLDGSPGHKQTQRNVKSKTVVVIDDDDVTEPPPAVPTPPSSRRRRPFAEARARDEADFQDQLSSSKSKTKLLPARDMDEGLFNIMHRVSMKHMPMKVKEEDDSSSEDKFLAGT